MTKPTPPPSPLLQRFREYQPGDIFTVAAKIHLQSAFEECKGNTLRRAAWNEDMSALVVTFAGGHQTTLMLEGARLLTTCTCRQWQPARNCPHVVIAWATLKRIVTPGSLSHISINRQMLLDMKSCIDPDSANREEADTGRVEPAAVVNEIRRLHRQHMTQEAARSTAANYRLLIEQSEYDMGIRGAVKRGEESVYGWTAHGLPTGLARFLATHYSYDSSPRYFESFLQMTGSSHPIVFRDADGRETPLKYQGDRTCTAGITFDIRGDEIHVSRSLADGTTLPATTIVHGKVLFDLAAGSIAPVANSDAWKSWEAVVEMLDRTEDGCDEYDERDESDEWDDEAYPEPTPRTPGIRRTHHSVLAPLELFNHATIRLVPKAIEDPNAHFHFLVNGTPATQGTARPSYQVNIPHGLTGTTTSLVPVSQFEQQTFAFYPGAFWLFNPYRRSNLSTPMKTKKRVRAVIETAFALLDESKTSARNSIVRSLTSSPDFVKRVVKREAKQLVTYLGESWDNSLIIPMTAQGEWQFLNDDHRIQAQLLRILYDQFGLDAFVGSNEPIRLEVATDKLLKVLPLMTARLQTEGFSLHIGNEPLTAAVWEFSLDATTSSLDWFELRPEIRCNGELLTDAELRGLMDGGGMVRRDGKLMLLDDISAQVMAMFSGAMPAGKKRRKGEQEPVRVPRLQILDWLNLRNHGVRIDLSPDDSRVLESLLNFSTIPERPLPTGLNATLRHYQVDAWHWLAFLYEHRFGACLADDMGLGKTLQGITLLAGIISGELASAAAPGTPHLVVAPPSLLFNWEAEIARFLPSARVMLYAGNRRSTADFSNHDIIITSYGIVQRDCDVLSAVDFNVLIFDETQVVKNLQAATTNAVRKLRGSFTLALTGTPVENHLGEYYAIMDLCLPGLLGTREEFSRGLNRDGAAGTARLIGRTRPFVLRRTKQLIANELPPKIEMDIPLELTQKQRIFYQRTVEEVRGQVKEAYESHAPAQARIIALTAILRLRQICLAPALASPGAGDASPKLEFLAEQLLELRDEGHSALVFSQFTGYLDLIEQGLKHHGLTCLRLDGSTPVPQRKKLVHSFQNAVEPSVFLISLKAGGKGLNLTRATYVYHMDPWWNPAVENQASDRAHRIGQTEQVTITRLIMRHTIEEKMMALKEQKTKLYKAILEDGASSGGAGLSREDFEFLLG